MATKTERILMSAYGVMVCTLTKAEAEEMESRGAIKRITGRKYRQVEPAAASKSLESSPMLTRSDIEAIAGLRKMDMRRKERLMGWGLIAAPRELALQG